MGSLLPDCIICLCLTVRGRMFVLILKSIQCGELYAEKLPRGYIIPKEKLIRFLAEKSGMAIKYKSAFHKKMLQILIEREVSK